MSKLKVGSLFSGVGGLDLAVEAFFDAETAWHCEFDPEPSKVLATRWPGVPNLGDITAVDWATVEPVDILCGGFPCQDLSLAGRRKGLRPGTRSGLWADFKAAIAALRPSVVVIENVRGLLSGCAESDSDVEPCPGCVGDGAHRPLVRAIGRVLGDLASLGFDAEWGSLRASDVGAPHGRFRVFVVAYSRSIRLGAGWDAASRQAEGGRSSAVDSGRGRTPVALLGTPTTRDWKDGSEVANVDVNGLLGRQVWSLLPTPQVADATGGHARRGGDRADELLLPGVATALLPTPRASADRTSRGAADSSSSSPSLGQSIELMLGNVPREFPSVNEMPAGWTRLLPTPRASRGAASTETMYALGAERNDAGDRQGNVTGEVSWGAYEAAVRRWEALTRPAPSPTRPDGKSDAPRLSPLLPEWMMGYSAGWVTDILDRNPAIKACGNGVCPQQAFAALSELWPRVLDSLAVAA